MEKMEALNNMKGGAKMELPVRKTSRAYDIMSAFLEPKAVEEVVNEVAEKRPTDKKSKIRGQVNAIIKDIKTGKKPTLTLEEENGKYKIVEKKA